MKLNKLATGIVAAAIAVTTASVPAKADEDFNKLLAIIAGGLVINEIVKNKDDSTSATSYKKKRTRTVTHRHDDGTLYTHPSQRHFENYHKDDHLRRDNRYDRDAYWDRSDRGTRRHPIQDRIDHFDRLPMPEKCRRVVRTKKNKKLIAYSKRCLKKHKYRVDKKGLVRHSRWPGKVFKPNLI
jgi:hypothetical protein